MSLFRITRLVVCAVEVSLLVGVLFWYRASRRKVSAALLASAWTLFVCGTASLLGAWLNWTKLPSPGVLGMPPDLLFGRIVVGGFLIALCFPESPIFKLYAYAFLCDLSYGLFIGEALTARNTIFRAVIVAGYFVPAQLFSRLTRNKRRLGARASLHVIFHSGLLLLVLPSLLLACFSGSWSAPFARPSFLNKLYLQLLLIPAVLLLTSVQEFAQRGGGTPMPSDPPDRLVTSGMYSYVANPMQIGKFLMLAGWGLFWWNPWIVFAACFGLLYSILIAAPREDRDMARRFGGEWSAYRSQVRRWWPRWKPYQSSPQVAHLFLQLPCGPCRQVERWLRRQVPTGLIVLDIQKFNMPRRITYQTADGTSLGYGVVALARALDHINLVWGFLGCMLRIPGIAWFAQLIADAFDPSEAAECAFVARPAPVHSSAALPS